MDDHTVKKNNDLETVSAEIGGVSIALRYVADQMIDDGTPYVATLGHIVQLAVLELDRRINELDELVPLPARAAD